MGADRRVATTALAVWLLALAGEALAEEALAPPASEVAGDGAAAAPQPVTLRCRDVLCLCADQPALTGDEMIYEPLAAAGCARVACSCATVASPRPSAPLASAPDRPPTPPAREAVLPPPVAPPPRLAPAPEAGFLLEPRRLGLRAEAGWPFFGVQVAYGAHDVVEVAAGYRGAYGLASGFYGGIRLRLHESLESSAALSIVAIGGYSYVQSGEGHNRTTLWVGGDSGFGEVSLAASVGRGRAWFTFAGGARVAGVQGHYCSVYGFWTENCDQAVFHDGAPGVLVTVMLEAGFAVRLNAFLSLYGAVGGDWFVNSEAQRKAFVRGRLGLTFDLAVARRRR
jgi:hypothetical protein